jgi:hypothetical protein
MTDIDWKQAFEFERDNFQRETVRAFRLSQQLAECQAREKVLRQEFTRLHAVVDATEPTQFQQALRRADKALSIPSDSTALDAMKQQARRAALLGAADIVDINNMPLKSRELRRMAEELK